MKCLHNTGGNHCEHCRDGFFGDALHQDCRRKWCFLFCHPAEKRIEFLLNIIECNCDVLGTNQTIQHCNRVSGQCPCLKNVDGIRCDHCIENHWKIASGEGCEACDCDPIGAESNQCNPVCTGFRNIFQLYFENFFGFSMMDNVSVNLDSVVAVATSVRPTSGEIQMFSVIVSITFFCFQFLV